MFNRIDKDAQVKKIQKKYDVNKKIGFFAFFALTASMVMTIYEYASFASAGWALIMFLFIGGLCWFIPVAIMAAEMATVNGWTEGGLFTWVEKTLGRRWGFAAIFFQWFEITIGFIPMLLFIITMLSFGFGGSTGLYNVTGNLIDTTVGSSNFGNVDTTLTWGIVGSTFGVAILIFVCVCASQIFGIRYTSIVSRVGFTGGIIVPFILLFIFGVMFVSKHGLNGSMDSFMPSSDESGSIATISQLVIFVSFILSFLGVEASASHIKSLKNPKRNYPWAMALLVTIAIVFSSVASIFIAIATKVGSNGETELSYTAGIIQAFLIMTNSAMSTDAAIGLVRFISILMGLGVIAEIAGWVVGPSKAMQSAAENGLLPQTFAKQNRFGVPIHLMLLQGTCVIVWAIVIIFGLIGGIGLGESGAGNSNNAGFLASMQITVLIYLLAYFLMMVAYLKFSIAKKNTYDSTVVILKHKWMKVTCFGIAIATNAFSYIVALFPQSSDTSTYGLYYGIIFGLLIPSALAPFIIYYWNQKRIEGKDPITNFFEKISHKKQQTKIQNGQIK